MREAGHVHVIDFFALLGINRGFKIDLKDAEKRYRGMQKLVHPDKASQSTVADDYCALLNEAIVVLKSPLKRADHLLELHGKKVNSEEFKMTEDSKLLIEIMETNEEIDEALGDRQKLETILSHVRDKKAICDGEMAGAYDALNFEQLLRLVERMRFLERVDERIEGLLRY